MNLKKIFTTVAIAISLVAMSSSVLARDYQSSPSRGGPKVGHHQGHQNNKQCCGCESAAAIAELGEGLILGVSRNPSLRSELNKIYLTSYGIANFDSCVCKGGHPRQCLQKTAVKLKVIQKLLDTEFGSDPAPMMEPLAAQ